MSEPIGSVIVGNQRSSDERTDSGKGKDASSDVASLAKLGAKALQREMGTRVQRAAEDREGPIKRKKTSAETETAAKRLRLGSTIIAGGADARNGYMPKTRETKLAWEELLNNLQALLADDEQQALRECAEEALDVLRDTKKRDIDKKPLVERILDLRVSDEFFHKILTLSRRLTDYTSPEDKKDVDMIDIGAEEEGVAVVFEDEESEGEYEENAAAGVGAGEAKGKGASDEMVIEDDEDEDGVETRADVGLQSAKKDEEDDEAEAQDYVDAKEIDAHWIQRTMGKLSDNEEAHETQRRAEQVLAILADETKTDVESALMQLFQWQLFDFIKLCIKNRWKIVWCTKMTRAKGEARFELASALKIKEYGPSILEELERETKKSDAENRAFRQQLRQQQAQGAGFEDKTKNLLDLKELTFEHEGHTMSNTTCELPRGSQTEMKKGYKTIYVPAYKKRVANAASLVSIKSLPEWTHPAFAKMTTLNAMQSKAFPCAFERDDHMLLCAPTAAGKTNVAMLAVLHEVSKCVRDGQIDEELLDDVKVVYIAPMKALVQEVVSNFGARLAPFQMKVSELTGDSSMTRAEIAASHMIVTTPEKWDIVTRKAGEKTHMQQVKLLIIDEIHLLHDARGPILEAIIARTIRHIEVTQEYTRLLGLSATLPNYEDVATILRVQKSADPSKNGLFYFDSSYRPVPLQQQYIGVTEKKPMKRRGVMNDIVYEKIMAQAGKNQVIVFVHSRKDTVVTAKMVRDKALENEMLGRFFSEDAAKKELLVSESESVQDPGLRNLLPFGFGVHHAGLVRKDRQTVEDLFSQGFLQVLVSTATLAWGVNLPAHTVIIKGTQIYNPEKGKWTELSSMDVLQMIGRAGRPQFDTQGEGIIITGQAELQFYLSLLNQQLPIESQFVSKIVDQLNAEVVMGSVQNTREASQWLKYTYLYVRMRANPSLYGISDEEIQDDRKLEQRRADLIHTAALQLDRASLVKYDRKSGLLEATDLGRVCSYYYLTCGTISKFNELLKPTMHELDVFRLFAMADEFKQISVREEEKMELTRLLERVPIPVREGVDDPLAKVNVLLQTHISQLTLDGYALMADMVYVTQSATRIVRAMFEIVVKKGWAQLAELLLNVAKQVERRIWLSHSPLRQMKGIPLETIDRLEKKNFSWDRYYNLSPSDLATLIDNPAAAKKIHRYIHMLPRLELDATAQPITRSLLRIELVITPDFHYEPRIHGSSEPFLIFVEDPDGERLLHVEPFVLKEQYSREEQLVYFYVPMFEPMPPQYFIKVISERWLWSETVLPVRSLFVVLCISTCFVGNA
ncbi:putative U5 small nuclear ribonucleoprotein 200 kDa helicase [Diplonema papillatum]|nr:putative U5 small nuclear ribonucleoprotein 200 kDa helicase [Diplonema papillatum]